MNHRNVLKLSLIIMIIMVVFAMMFPFLYNVLCKKTGIDGKALRALEGLDTLQIDMSRQIRLEFDSHADRRRNISFYPSISFLNIHPGEPYTLAYHLVNHSGYEYILQAIPSMTPPITSKHMRKIECFCFQPQLLKPYEHRILPLKIVIDTDIPTYIHTMTLSYALFEIEEHHEVFSTSL